jgi:hypothetical protein
VRTSRCRRNRERRHHDFAEAFLVAGLDHLVLLARSIAPYGQILRFYRHFSAEECDATEYFWIIRLRPSEPLSRSARNTKNSVKSMPVGVHLSVTLHKTGMRLDILGIAKLVYLASRSTVNSDYGWRHVRRLV